MKYFIKTFGCQMNENDSNMISAIMQKSGHNQCLNVNQADIIIINTCCIRQSAENKALGFIGSIKTHKSLHRNSVVAVCGCLPQMEQIASNLAAKHRHLDIIIGTYATAQLPAYIEEFLTYGKRIIDVEKKFETDTSLDIGSFANAHSKFRAQVNINYGCNNYCSYCIVPYVRGPERSRTPEAIIRDIKNLAELGVKEVQLLGQNVNSYGKDFKDISYNFAQLLEDVHQIEGIMKIRYMTSHPRDFNRHLVETIADLPKVCHHFHLPIQSGSDRILALMNRGYSTADYLDKIGFIRKLIDDATITTDFIVGFPGESDQDFQDTLSLLDKADFDTAYTFLYSSRSGTKAAKMPDQLDRNTKNERLQMLMDKQNPISLAKNEQLIGTIQEVMIEGISKNRQDMFAGRTDGNKIVVFPIITGLKPGDLVKIKIESAKTWNLAGKQSI
jgi:tRNA-2-methylthio-N6-dimethylallyladenosine synthase